MTPDSIKPDTKSWTWVLFRPCVECGFDAAAVQPSAVHHLIRRDAANWIDRLHRPGVAERPRPDVWSTLEYGCHVRDVHRIFAERVRLMLTQDQPQFPNWDQDETAVTDDYPSQDPVRVAASYPTPPRRQQIFMPFSKVTTGDGAACAVTAANSQLGPLRSITCTTWSIIRTT